MNKRTREVNVQKKTVRNSFFTRPYAITNNGGLSKWRRVLRDTKCMKKKTERDFNKKE